MQIFATGIDGSLRSVDVSAETTVAELKSLLLAGDDAVLSYESKILADDSAPVSMFGIRPESTLHVSARLLGGKVHGSLARAGKVRAQTPKVEKQEKKKKKTGRAARRIQYNRRFVNVAVNQPGRKRGPNSNAK
ncbi:unnamed protein product [Gongylonema pulchrum]|uniref:40S ribosomal protein S30 n=1 Tax=Gongylonema pulchrum TaxID=637853 RepID=A0A183DHH6_9BILA|nr:unnamed protein product [Gongylonema pulchrum]